MPGFLCTAGIGHGKEKAVGFSYMENFGRTGPKLSLCTTFFVWNKHQICSNKLLSISVGLVEPDNPTPVNLHYFLPFTRTTLLTRSPTETAGENLHHWPSITLFTSRKEGNPSAPAGKPRTRGHPTMLPPSTCFYVGTRIGTAAPTFAMLHLSVTNVPKCAEKSYTEDSSQESTGIS